MKAYALKIGALQVGAGKVPPLQADAGKIGARKVRSPQDGPGKAHATKVGAREIGAGEIAPLKVRAAEHTAATIVGCFGEECSGVLRSGIGRKLGRCGIHCCSSAGSGMCIR